jgi:hypothetical protein
VAVLWVFLALFAQIRAVHAVGRSPSGVVRRPVEAPAAHSHGEDHPDLSLDGPGEPSAEHEGARLRALRHRRCVAARPRPRGRAPGAHPQIGRAAGALHRRRARRIRGSRDASGDRGLARLAQRTASPTATLRATIDTDFTGGDAQAPARLTEQLLGSAPPGLAILAPQVGCAVRGRGPFAHAVAFHGQNDTEAVAGGGGLQRDAEQTALKNELKTRIRDALLAVMDDPPLVVVKRSGPLAGVERANIVNGITVGGNGIQLEQPAPVRTVDKQRDAIAQAVAALYADLI